MAEMAPPAGAGVSTSPEPGAATGMAPDGQEVSLAMLLVKFSALQQDYRSFVDGGRLTRPPTRGGMAAESADAKAALARMEAIRAAGAPRSLSVPLSVSRPRTPQAVEPAQPASRQAGPRSQRQQPSARAPKAAAPKARNQNVTPDRVRSVAPSRPRTPSPLRGADPPHQAAGGAKAAKATPGVTPRRKFSPPPWNNDFAAALAAEAAAEGSEAEAGPGSTHSAEQDAEEQQQHGTPVWPSLGAPGWEGAGAATPPAPVVVGKAGGLLLVIPAPEPVTRSVPGRNNRIPVSPLPGPSGTARAQPLPSPSGSRIPHPQPHAGAGVVVVEAAPLSSSGRVERLVLDPSLTADLPTPLSSATPPGRSGSGGSRAHTPRGHGSPGSQPSQRPQQQRRRQWTVPAGGVGGPRGASPSPPPHRQPEPQLAEANVPATTATPMFVASEPHTHSLSATPSASRRESTNVLILAKVPTPPASRPPSRPGSRPPSRPVSQPASALVADLYPLEAAGASIDLAASCVEGSADDGSRVSTPPLCLPGPPVSVAAADAAEEPTAPSAVTAAAAAAAAAAALQVAARKGLQGTRRITGRRDSPGPLPAAGPSGRAAAATSQVAAPPAHSRLGGKEAPPAPDVAPPPPRSRRTGKSAAAAVASPHAGSPKGAATAALPERALGASTVLGMAQPAGIDDALGPPMDSGTEPLFATFGGDALTTQMAAAAAVADAAPPSSHPATAEAAQAAAVAAAVGPHPVGLSMSLGQQPVLLQTPHHHHPHPHSVVFHIPGGSNCETPMVRARDRADYLRKLSALKRPMPSESTSRRLTDNGSLVAAISAAHELMRQEDAAAAAAAAAGAAGGDGVGAGAAAPIVGGTQSADGRLSGSASGSRAGTADLEPLEPLFPATSSTSLSLTGESPRYPQAGARLTRISRSNSMVGTSGQSELPPALASEGSLPMPALAAPEAAASRPVPSTRAGQLAALARHRRNNSDGANGEPPPAPQPQFMATAGPHLTPIWPAASSEAKTTTTTVMVPRGPPPQPAPQRDQQQQQQQPSQRQEAAPPPLSRESSYGVASGSLVALEGQRQQQLHQQLQQQHRQLQQHHQQAQQQQQQQAHMQQQQQGASEQRDPSPTGRGDDDPLSGAPPAGSSGHAGGGPAPLTPEQYIAFAAQYPQVAVAAAAAAQAAMNLAATSRPRARWQIPEPPTTSPAASQAEWSSSTLDLGGGGGGGAGAASGGQRMQWGGGGGDGGAGGYGTPALEDTWQPNSTSGNASHSRSMGGPTASTSSQHAAAGGGGQQPQLHSDLRRVMSEGPHAYGRPGLEPQPQPQATGVLPSTATSSIASFYGGGGGGASLDLSTSTSTVWVSAQGQGQAQGASDGLRLEEQSFAALYHQQQQQVQQQQQLRQLLGSHSAGNPWPTTTNQGQPPSNWGGNGGYHTASHGSGSARGISADHSHNAGPVSHHHHHHHHQDHYGGRGLPGHGTATAASMKRHSNGYDLRQAPSHGGSAGSGGDGGGDLPDYLRISASKMVAGWQAPNAAAQQGALSGFNDVWHARSRMPHLLPHTTSGPLGPRNASSSTQQLQHPHQLQQQQHLNASMSQLGGLSGSYSGSSVMAPASHGGIGQHQHQYQQQHPSLSGPPPAAAPDRDPFGGMSLAQVLATKPKIQMVSAYKR